MRINCVIQALTKRQQEFYLGCQEQIAFCISSPQIGKTTGGVIWFFEQFLKGINSENVGGKTFANYWWVAPTYGQTKVAFRRTVGMIKLNNKDWRQYFKINESELYIIWLLEGQTLHFKSAEVPDNLFGESVCGIFLDEFTRMRPEAWEVIYSRTLASNGFIRGIGNYLGESNWWVRKIKDANYQLFKYDLDIGVRDNIISEVKKEEIINDLKNDQRTLQQLYYLKDVGGSDALYIANEIVAMFSRGEHLMSDVALASTLPNRRFMAIDIALKKDAFTIIIFCETVLAKVYVLKPENEGERLDPMQCKGAIMQLKETYNIPISNIVYDDSGIGAFLGDATFKGSISYNGGKRAETTFVSRGKKLQVPLQFNDLRTQCLYKLREMMPSITICGDISTKFKSMIHEELSAYEYFVEGFKITVSSKNAMKIFIGRSTDFTDPIQMFMLFHLSLSNDSSALRDSTTNQYGALDKHRNNPTRKVKAYHI